MCQKWMHGYFREVGLPARDDDTARRQSWAEELAGRLDRPMSVLGVLFLLVVLGQAIAAHPTLVGVLSAMSWLLWLVFVGEYVLRLYVAPDRGAFLRRTWWQLIFLVVPVLRFLRLARIGRLGRVLSSTVRGGRSAGRLLSGRVAWLASLSAIVALAASQLLYTAAAYPDYASALHDAALATITGERVSADGPTARVVEVVLAAYSVVVFATLAASLGAFFLRQTEQQTEER
jgi:voltage-gated potassium channel